MEGAMYKTRRIRTNGAKLEQGLGQARPNKWQTMWQNIFKH
jgi:hypothetical protein